MGEDCFVFPQITSKQSFFSQIFFAKRYLKGAELNLCITILWKKIWWKVFCSNNAHGAMSSVSSALCRPMRWLSFTVLQGSELFVKLSSQEAQKNANLDVFVN